ncbi:uncharacterized protein LOC144986792 [Oryzias latipes]
MLSVQTSVFTLLLLVIGTDVSCEELTAVKKEESTLEGTSVALSYKYKNSATGNDYFFWYRQFPGKPPEFLISHSGTGTPISQPVPGFSFKVSDDQRQMDLQISSAAVTDSAVYYCAVWSTGGFGVVGSAEPAVLPARGSGCSGGGGAHSAGNLAGVLGLVPSGRRVGSAADREWQPDVSCEELTAVKKEESTLEGTFVSLSYKYKNAAKGSDQFYWYRQFPGKPTKFLISHSGTGTPISQPVPGFSFKVSDEKRQMDLQISSAAVTDSAVYYCAVRPTVTGNNKTLYKNLQQHNTTKYPLEGVTDCESTDSLDRRQRQQRNEALNITDRDGE